MSVDEERMRLALKLARLGERTTRPNPPVGALLVGGDGEVLGAGAHELAGGHHAEVFALRGISRAPEDATLYVTLEPCSTWGRTPPCTDLIERLRVRRIVVAMVDPNPRHCGRGIALLERHGVSLDVGVLGEECSAFYDDWLRQEIRAA